MAPRFASTLLLLALSCTLVAGWQCPKECEPKFPDGCRNAHFDCPCLCEPNKCPESCCEAHEIEDGCGGPKIKCEAKPCPPSCPTECEVWKNNMKFKGTCSKTPRADTICGGQGSCGENCGQCYINDNEICGHSNGPCASANKCRCFKSRKGASCKADNIISDFISNFDASMLGNGGGCDESMCNAFSHENGDGPMACCPYGCDKSDKSDKSEKHD